MLPFESLEELDGEVGVLVLKCGFLPNFKLSHVFNVTLMLPD